MGKSYGAPPSLLSSRALQRQPRGLMVGRALTSHRRAEGFSHFPRANWENWEGYVGIVYELVLVGFPISNRLTRSEYCWVTFAPAILYEWIDLNSQSRKHIAMVNLLKPCLQPHCNLRRRQSRGQSQWQTHLWIQLWLCLCKSGYGNVNPPFLPLVHDYIPFYKLDAINWR